MEDTLTHLGETREQVEWVDAAPFRAHALHLMRAGDLSDAVLAELTGVVPRAMRHLVYGRAGHRVRRLCADHARRLLRVTTDEARQLRVRPVPAVTTRRRLRVLLRHGHAADALAGSIGLEVSELTRLVDGRTPTCTQLTALRTAALYAQLGFSENGDDPAFEVRAA